MRMSLNTSSGHLGLRLALIRRWRQPVDPAGRADRARHAIQPELVPAGESARR